jgi:hypothetical protein
MFQNIKTWRILAKGDLGMALLLYYFTSSVSLKLLQNKFPNFKQVLLSHSVYSTYDQKGQPHSPLLMRKCYLKFPEKQMFE